MEVKDGILSKNMKSPGFNLRDQKIKNGAKKLIALA